MSRDAQSKRKEKSSNDVRKWKYCLHHGYGTRSTDHSVIKIIKMSNRVKTVKEENLLDEDNCNIVVEDAKLICASRR